MLQYGMHPLKTKESARENFPLQGNFQLTCGTEEKDVWVSQELIQFVGDMRLSVGDRAEVLLVLFTQVWINVVKQQGKRRAPATLDLRHANGISRCHIVT